MSWSKVKQNLESFLSPTLVGRVEYRATGYRYLPDKAGTCYIAVDKKNVLDMGDKTNPIRWYQSEMEIKQDSAIRVPVDEEEFAALRRETGGRVPEDRLLVMARGRKLTGLAKDLMAAQAALGKSNFAVVANQFLSMPIEESLESKDMVLNILALIDKRVGKKRLMNMRDKMQLKHPAVQFFYELRI